MIGRFSQPGVYRELLQSWEFIRLFAGAGLALSGYLWDTWAGAQSLPGLILVLACVALNGYPILWGAISGLLRRQVNVDELVSLAIIASLIQGEFLTAAVVILVMVTGSLIEEATTEGARKAIQGLVSLSPPTATLLVNGQPVTKSVSEVRVRDLLLVKPGDQVPVDARVLRGTTAVDESALTGEPFPRDKEPGDTVFAGTFNQHGVIEIEATAVGEDTTLGKVIKLVEAAESHKPKTVRLIDHYAQWFTPLILACALLAWAVTGEPNRAITVLIVGCPCALILAAPTALVATIGRAARSGILVKGGQYLEAVAAADIVLFDKTGTLTEGQPRVDQILPAAGVDPQQVLTLAACVEQHSTHPLARAVLKAAHYAKVVISQVEGMCHQIGLGVRATVQGRLVEVGSANVCGIAGNIPVDMHQHLDDIKAEGSTPLMVFQDQRLVGIISVADRIRARAAETMRQLRSLGVEQVGILSGDHHKSARLVAEAVGLEHAWGEMLPADKLKIIKNFQSQNKKVLFVGDGINDAPSLAAADVGIAMGAAGTEVALETADIALMHDDISRIPLLISLSRRMLTIIKWNLAFSLIFNAAAVVASGWGWLSPISGALVHNLGSVLVVLSSASIAFTREERN